MRKIPISILCGIVSVFVTIVLYFLIIGNIFARLICFVTLIGLILAEVAVMLMAYFSKAEPRKVAATVVVSFMIPLSVILSVVYIMFFPNGYGSYFGYYFSSFAILALIAVVLWKFSINKTEENANLQNARRNILDMRKLVKVIMLEPGAERCKSELCDIEDKLHFSNDTVVSEADSLIWNMLEVLQSNINDENFDVSSCVQAIEREIDRRNIINR